MILRIHLTCSSVIDMLLPAKNDNFKMDFNNTFILLSLDLKGSYK